MTDWALSDLEEFLENKEKNDAADQASLAAKKSEVIDYFKSVVVPAFEEMKVPLEKHGRKVEVFGCPDNDSVSIQVGFKGKRELDYSIFAHIRPRLAHLYVVTKTREAGQYFRSESPLKLGAEDSIETILREDIMQSFLEHYRSQTEPSKG